MKKILLVIIGLLVVVAVVKLTSFEESPEKYKSQIETHRTQIADFMRSSAKSPFKSLSDSPMNLQYFSADLKYKVSAKISLIEKKSFLTLGNSDGSSTKYQKYAYAHFQIDERPFKLLVLKGTESKNAALSIAFSDLTSGDQTYGGGRYLDVDFKRAKRITLDFNKAYNPYCIYNIKYTCPLPPKENSLDIAILAGEKIYGNEP